MTTLRDRPDNATLAGYLRGARALLDDPERWTPERQQPEPWRKALARSARGLVRAPHAIDAVCWSLEGAIDRQVSAALSRRAGSFDDLRMTVREWQERTGLARAAVIRTLKAMPGEASLLASCCADLRGYVHIDAWASWKTHAEVLAVLDAAIRDLEPDGRP